MLHPAFRIRARAVRPTEIKNCRSQRELREEDVAYPVARDFQFCREIASLLPRGGW